MPRYVAFLRAVGPTNASMPELKRCFEAAGFSEVKTVLASGNVVFSARAASDAALERKAEAAMTKRLGKAFYTIVRSTEELQKLLDADPFARYRLPANAKRVVTFMRTAHGARLRLPLKADGARIVAVMEREAFTIYVPMPRVALFMALIEKTFGKNVTTRSWDTVKKCAAA
jgi:uncharacterized protein (DUF1697 family)